MPCSRIGHTTLPVRLPAPDAGRVSNVDCRHHRFPLTPLPYAEEKLPRLCSPDDGGERENSLRLAGLDLRNQARWLPGDHGLRFCRPAAPLVAQRPSAGSEVSGRGDRGL
jgi:hypothetical protein